MHKNNFLKYIEFEKRYSKHTLTSYNTDLTQFFNFLHESKKSNFKCSIYPDISNITELLSKEVYKVYALLKNPYLF